MGFPLPIASLRPLTPAELHRVEPLVRGSTSNPYRNYRIHSSRAQQAVMLAEVEAALKNDGGIVLHESSAAGEWAAVAQLLPWETQFFGVPMARIGFLLANPRALLADAARHILAELRARGVRHVSIRVDVAEVETVQTLEERGFRLVDSLVTYITRPGAKLGTVRNVGVIRDLRPEDAPQLLEITAEAYRGFRGRFYLDPHLPRERSDAFYVEWARQAIAMTMADAVVVCERGSEILGYVAYRRREPVSSAGGVPIYGGGIGACRADAPGAYAGLIRESTLRVHALGGVAEVQTQNFNLPVIRINEALGASFVRGEYTLHGWIE